MPNVLLVEDNPVNQKVAAGLLKQIGILADIANDGLEGIQAFRRKPYDLIIMDCQMPRLDGWECTRAVRKLEASSGGGRRVPIVALTAQALPGDREKCLSSGMDDYLTKPVDADLFLKAVQAHLAGTAVVPSPTATGATTGPSASVATAPVAPAGPSPILDPVVVAKIRSYGDDALGDVYGTLKEELPGRRNQMSNALALGDLKTLATIAHAVKGGTGTLGCRDLHLRCADLERLARSNDLAGCQALWPGLDGSLTATIAALAALLAP